MEICHGGETIRVANLTFSRRYKDYVNLSGSTNMAIELRYFLPSRVWAASIMESYQGGGMGR